MKGHEEIERILAGYRDATPQERATADAHIETCSQCAARLVAYSEVDRALASLPQPGLPLSLSRPLASLVAVADRRRQAPHRSSSALGFAFRGLAPAGLILLVIVTLSAVLWSVNSVRIPATSTPALTMTLTPTTVSTETEVIGYHHSLSGLPPASDPGPTPAPVPAPIAQPSASAIRARSPVLLAGYSAHATITN